MVRIIDSRPLLRKFEKLERESRRQNNGNVNVGYAASYALFVHENLEAAHGEAFNAKHASDFGKRNKKGQFLKGTQGKRRGPGQQAKYLEQPFREMRSELMQITVNAMKGGASLIKGLLVAGLQLQRASQRIVPTDLGNLKASAFTEKE